MKLVFAIIHNEDAGALVDGPAGLLAQLGLADLSLGARIHVLMPYTDRLREFAEWYRQLWAESLGKVRRDGTFVGQTPLAALGATDQHSQVQLFMEGPADKTVTFIGVADFWAAQPVTVKKSHRNRSMSPLVVTPLAEEPHQLPVKPPEPKA